MAVGKPLFGSIKEDRFDKLGEELVDGSGGGCIIQHGSEAVGCSGSLCYHD